MKRLAVALLSLLFAAPALATPAGTAHRGGSGGTFNGSATAPTGGSANATFYPDMIWNTPSLDDPPGVANGDGADSNPFTGSSISMIESGVLMAPFTYMMDPIHVISSYNEDTGLNFTPAASIYSSSLNFEYGYDNTQRSFAGTVEHYWQFNPNTFRITFAGGGGSFSLGDNITFSDGAVCRPTQSGSVGTATYRFYCVGAVAPAAAATISSCTGTCTGGPTGTVNGTPKHENLAFRPFFYTYFMNTNRVDVSIERGYDGADTNCSTGSNNGDPAGTCPIMYWLQANSGEGILHLGHASGSTDAQQVRLAIPHAADVAGQGLGYGAGTIAIDTTLAGAAGGAPRFIFSDEASPGFFQWAVSPIQHYCYQYSDATNAFLENGDANVNAPFAPSYPWILLGLACRDDTTAAPATPATITVETLAGAAITLGGTVTCAGNATAMTYQSVTLSSNSTGMHPSDADAALAAGAGVRIDVTNTPNPATDRHTICIAYMPQSS